MLMLGLLSFEADGVSFALWVLRGASESFGVIVPCLLILRYLGMYLWD